jgi:hypothetical protein
MGMDVFGEQPTSKQGEYFRRNVWGWTPLAEFICDKCEEEAQACKEWHVNNGDGLDASGALRLADRLEALIADGSAARYVAERDAVVSALPDEPCPLCKGTGIRPDEVSPKGDQTDSANSKAVHPRNGEKGLCNGCNGRGSSPHFLKGFFLKVEDIREFAEFARASGGFGIW